MMRGTTSLMRRATKNRGRRRGTAGKEEIKRRDAGLTAIAEDIPFEEARNSNAKQRELQKRNIKSIRHFLRLTCQS
jgi:hypothetical protein